MPRLKTRLGNIISGLIVGVVLAVRTDQSDHQLIIASLGLPCSFKSESRGRDCPSLHPKPRAPQESVYSNTGCQFLGALRVVSCIPKESTS